MKPTYSANGPGASIVYSSKSDSADWVLIFLIGSMPVMYTAEKSLLVTLLFLNSDLRKSRYSRSDSTFSRSGASHSSMITTNFVSKALTASSSVAMKSPSALTEGSASNISRTMASRRNGASRLKLSQ